MEKDTKIYIAGHTGMVGSAIWRLLEKNGYGNLLGKPSSELDLTDQSATHAFFASEKPHYVVLAAARVGGILANDTYRGQFIYDNLAMEINVIEAARRYGTRKLLFLGSSCIYPRNAPQPIREESLLTGPLEPTNEPYAIAKIAGIRMCDAYNRQYGTNFISAMPTNLYGPGDNYHPENSHVVPALIRRFHEAKVQETGEVTCWGSGDPLREFLFSDDLAEACVFLLENVDYTDVCYEDAHDTIQSHINVGSGFEVTIRELAETVSNVVGYKGKICWDRSKPDGTPRKLLDSSRLNNLGWHPRVSLEEGISNAYKDFRQKPPE